MLRLFDVLLIFLYLLHFSRSVSFFPIIVSIDAGTHWVDRENIFAFLEVIGSKLKEKYNIWCKNELSTSFWLENTS